METVVLRFILNMTKTGMLQKISNQTIIIFHIQQIVLTCIFLI